VFQITEESLKRARATQVLIAANLVVFVLAEVLPRGQFGDWLVQYNAAVLYGGEWWRLFTALFAHSGPLHLLNNMVALLAFGVAAEETLSRAQYLGLYFGAGLVGSVLILWLAPPNYAVVGASGAIYGLMGMAFVTIGLRDRRLLLFALLNLGVSLVYSFAPGVATLGHFGGLAVGLAFGAWFVRHYVPPPGL
jgi:membrane associated rhomboid family serine protease